MVNHPMNANDNETPRGGVSIVEMDAAAPGIMTCTQI